MEYALGFIAGLLVALLVVATLIFFRSQVERRIQIVEKWLEGQGPHPTGGVFIPEDDAEATRREIIEKNRREGRDTPLSELR